ncbi:hypothetical protein GIB67_017120 [Kingdonia uniflora]|uniref:Myb-like domain-containing protein n=1 Tax=Kingdonia uniflora TaxID=39325 RepID=A0A7J7NCN5_9MAGN|nr:hypothetical protein GIB67_017120 [Kingdonia uniflora]
MKDAIVSHGGGGRDDCWTESETSTLMDAWGDRYLQLNRGNLRQKDWKEVADAVNICREGDKKPPRTDVQCRNRVDTVKKKYKLEKTKPGTSSWPLFDQLDYLIGQAGSGEPVVTPLKKIMPPPIAYRPPWVNLAVKKETFDPNPNPNHKSNGRAVYRDGSSSKSIGSTGSSSLGGGGEEEEEEEEDGVFSNGGRKRRVGMDLKDGSVIGELAKSLLKFGEVYERMESARQEQMMELEKQRMEFAKDIEIQRMQMFMEAHLDLKRMKLTKRSNNGEHLSTRHASLASSTLIII